MVTAVSAREDNLWKTYGLAEREGKQQKSSIHNVKESKKFLSCGTA